MVMAVLANVTNNDNKNSNNYNNNDDASNSRIFVNSCADNLLFKHHK